MVTSLPIPTAPALEESGYVRPREAARFAGLSESEIRRAIYAGELPARKYKSKRWLIDRQELQAWLLRCTTPNVA